MVYPTLPAAIEDVAHPAATAAREGRFWVVDVPGVGVTQGRSVREARAMAADLVEAMTGKAEDVDVHFELPDDVRAAVEHARATTAEAQRLTSVAADEYRQAEHRRSPVAAGMLAGWRFRRDPVLRHF